ncbi:MAG TPA: hypothetical protein VMI12_09205 [Puia sp.]|nr:hypothetical protein [Puia sp.]
MKNLQLRRSCLPLICLLILLSAGCVKDRVTHTYTINIPVLKTMTEIRSTIKSGPAASFENIGKMYIQGNYIFLNEKDKGIHIIDNSVPSKPRNIAFINIPGNEDMAIKGSVLYADVYCDLVAFDISNPQNVIAKKFLTNIFPDRSGYNSSTNPDSILIITDWISKDTTVNYDPNHPIYYSSCPNCAIPISYFNVISNAAVPAASNSGTGGSMARFTLVNNYLYTVTNSTLNSFNVSTPSDPVFSNRTGLDWNIETIYPFDNKLYIGSTNGVYVYDIASSPDNPVFDGACMHLTSCDPVIADDKYAYVTLSAGKICNGILNELEIIDLNYWTVSSLGVIKTYSMTSPQGLSKDGNILFICDGKDGLKVYDASNVMNLKLLAHISNGNALDLIATDGIATVITTNGLFQYDYSDLTNIRLLSKL